MPGAGISNTTVPLGLVGLVSTGTELPFWKIVIAMSDNGLKFPLHTRLSVESLQTVTVIMAVSIVGLKPQGAQLGPPAVTILSGIIPSITPLAAVVGIYPGGVVYITLYVVSIILAIVQEPEESVSAVMIVLLVDVFTMVTVTLDRNVSPMS